MLQAFAVVEKGFGRCGSLTQFSNIGYWQRDNRHGNNQLIVGRSSIARQDGWAQALT